MTEKVKIGGKTTQWGKEHQKGGGGGKQRQKWSKAGS